MKKNIAITIISLFCFIAVIILLSYAYFTANFNTNSNTVYNTTFGAGYTFSASVTTPLNNETTFSITSNNMIWSGDDEPAVTANTTFTISLANPLDKDITCSYDYTWVWETGYDNYTMSTGATKEFTVSGPFAEAQIPNYNASDMVVGSSTISVNANNNNNKNDTLTIIFYNLANVDQSAHNNKQYRGHLTVDNVECNSVNQKLVDYIINDAPRSGIDAVSESPWILTSDHDGEWRYAGLNPDNYISFNGELWRIVGVMPSMEYCTGTYSYVYSNECNTTATGSLVKIVRNSALGMYRFDDKDKIGSSMSYHGSNDWSDSQLMLMLNGSTYLKTGYDINGNRLHTNYSVSGNGLISDGNDYDFFNSTYNYLDGSGTTVYIPSMADDEEYDQDTGSVQKKIDSSYINWIVTVRWDLYGNNSDRTTVTFYLAERNLRSQGSTYTVTASGREKRAVKWYGKIGLLYPSDLGYASNGSSQYTRTNCLLKSLANPDYGCQNYSYLNYYNITNSAPNTSYPDGRYLLMTLYPASSDKILYSNGNNCAMEAYVDSYLYHVRPALYLNKDIIITGGSGTWDDPYTINL